MEIFYSKDIDGTAVRLNPEESAHCVKVLRHREGDEIAVMDGAGTLLWCRLDDASPKEAVATVVRREPGFGSHPYRLTLAVCPTKNMDRYEWMAEKATEFGVDAIVPVIGERSERKVCKTERLERIVLSAAKQSLKASVPHVAQPLSVMDFIASFAPGASFAPVASAPVPGSGALPPSGASAPVSGCGALSPGGASASVPGSGALSPGGASAPVPGSGDLSRGGASADGGEPLKLIAYCFEGEKLSIREALEASAQRDVVVLIGPEGDFSPREVAAAMKAGFKPVHLGASRLRTETAALASAAALYYKYI